MLCTPCEALPFQLQCSERGRKQHADLAHCGGGDSGPQVAVPSLLPLPSHFPASSWGTRGLCRSTVRKVPCFLPYRRMPCLLRQVFQARPDWTPWVATPVPKCEGPVVFALAYRGSAPLQWLCSSSTQPPGAASPAPWCTFAFELGFSLQFESWLFQEASSVTPVKTYASLLLSFSFLLCSRLAVASAAYSAIHVTVSLLGPWVVLKAP